MAKKTRKVLKQESQQRAIQQAVTNVNTTTQAPAPAAPAAPQPVQAAAPSRPAAKTQLNEEQEFKFVKSDVRRSLTLASVFVIIMIALSLIIH